jgi:hypothetical protein
MGLASDVGSGDVLKLARRGIRGPGSCEDVMARVLRNRHTLRDVTSLEIATTEQRDVTYISYIAVQVLVRCLSSRCYVIRAGYLLAIEYDKPKRGTRPDPVRTAGHVLCSSRIQPCVNR